MVKLLLSVSSFGNGNENNDDNLEEHYDEAYKGRAHKADNNHGDPDQGTHF